MPVIPGRESKALNPFWTSDNERHTLYLGEVRDVLRQLPARSVQCVVTSPPYWGLRSYLANDHEHKAVEIGSEPSPDCLTSGQAQCGKCFVCVMVAVFREVRRVLRDDGTLWLNLGSSYWSDGKLGDSLLKDGPSKIRSAAVGSKDIPLVLRDDLTPDELRYVLTELASHFRQGSKVTEPD